jgi:CRP-like cAMP-binding protein
MPDFLQQESNFNQKILDAQGCLNKLSDAEKALLVNHKHDIEFQPGESIIKRGMLVNNVLYLTEGLAKLELENDHKTATVALVNSHSFIGIVCCFAFEQFDFTATALEKTKVSFIDITIFKQLIESNSEFALSLIQHMSGVSNSLLHRITSIYQKNIDGVLSMLLLEFSSLYGSLNFRIPMSRKEMANMLGYSKESVINTLSRFNKEDIINVSDRNIEILDLKKLQQIKKLG